MRALAEFIMRGRVQASLVAFIGNLLPLISPAAIGLVALRKGLPSALLVFLWGVLPLVLAFYVTDQAPTIVTASIAAVGVLYLGSGVLRKSAFWSDALIAIVALSAVTGFALNVLFPGQIQELLAVVVEVLTEVAKASNAEVPQVGTPLVLGFIGYVVALNAVASLLLARWWQALLYNPGGFQSEFHRLRLKATQAVVLVAGMIGCQVIAPDYAVWAKLFELPLLVGGIAMVHYTVALKKLGGHWLVLFYAGLIMFGPIVSAMLVGLGCVDSIANLRPRLKPAANKDIE